jgi:hypothetical protein
MNVEEGKSRYVVHRWAVDFSEIVGLMKERDTQKLVNWKIVLENCLDLVVVKDTVYDDNRNGEWMELQVSLNGGRE